MTDKAQSQDASTEKDQEQQPLPKTQKRRAKRRSDAEPDVSGAAHAAPAEDAEETGTKAAPKRKQARKGSGLPEEPTGIRYEESMRPERLNSGFRTFMSWNVAGLRALMKKDAGALRRLLDAERVAVLCLQEIKLQDKHVDDVTEALGLRGFTLHCNCSADKAGYSGVAMLVRDDAFEGGAPVVTSGMGLPDHDGEGRVMALELPDLYLVNTYVPNSGAELKRLEYRTTKWDMELSRYLDSLRHKKPVVVTGDFNCAREPIDIHNAKRNVKSAGFTPEERESFQKVYMDEGWIDTFRRQHEGVHGYTYYSYRFNMRAKKKGWRLDYFLASDGLADRLHDSFILPDFIGSDHCPIGLVLKDAP